MMKTLFTVLVGLGIFGGLLLLGTATSWFGLVTARPMAKYATETSAQVYDTSRQYQQAINRDVARYCRDYASTEGPARKAVADLIHSTLDTYQGELMPANTACVSQLGE